MIEPPLHLPLGWVWLLNLSLWPVISMMVSSMATRRHIRHFNVHGSWYAMAKWEQWGEIYQILFKVRSWKKRLPDGASWFSGGFSKMRLIARDNIYLTTFAQETCRGEWAHWLQLGCTPIFFLWNPLWADMIMVSYALCANIPCIIAQRYNRGRLLRLLTASNEKT